MTEKFTEKIREEMEKEFGPILGRKTRNCRLYKQCGNAAYEPTLFFCANIKDAIATALNLDTMLLVYDENTDQQGQQGQKDCNKDPWNIVVDPGTLMDERWDPAAVELTGMWLKALGHNRAVLRGGRIRREFYRLRA